MYFRIYRLGKTWFDKCLKSARLRGPAGRQHSKRAETLTQYHEQLLYHIHQTLGR